MRDLLRFCVPSVAGMALLIYCDSNGSPELFGGLFLAGIFASVIWTKWCERWSLRRQVLTLLGLIALGVLNEWVLHLDVLYPSRMIIRDTHPDVPAKMGLNVMVVWWFVIWLWMGLGIWSGVEWLWRIARRIAPRRKG